MPVRSDDELAQRVGRGVLTFRWADGFVGQLPLWGGQLIGEGGLEGGSNNALLRYSATLPGWGGMVSISVQGSPGAGISTFRSSCTWMTIRA